MSLITGQSPTDIENNWHVGDVNWVLATAQARDLARITVAKNSKAQLSDVILPYSVDVQAEPKQKRRTK